MTQQEFEHIYYSIKTDLIRLAGQFCRSASIDLDAEDAVQEALIAFCNKHRADIQRISEEYELTFVLFIPVLDAPDLVRILRLGELSIHTSHSVG